ncbi:hypothetical protein [Catenuloplanes indicus]|uniref:Uncharacterized protein n=1 Tax=Catenuloplanes indicus TaxID=137267 RepID=A0AAE3VTL3_9ACTN|nr:hypothetical protein [Catenuloplanes indicus]MDQ0363395.1 hypothetical protein [Catenuloplanes indicus]
MTIPTYTLRCHSADDATRLVPFLHRMGLIGAEADNGTVTFPYGSPNPMNTLIEVMELARHLDLAGDIDASELLIQGTR